MTLVGNPTSIFFKSSSATFYLLFLHVSWWSLSEAEWVSRRAATVNLRNFLLTAGFLVRIMTARSGQQRGLYIRIGVPIGLLGIEGHTA